MASSRRKDGLAADHLVEALRMPHLFAEQDVGTRRNQVVEEIAAPALERLLDPSVNAAALQSAR
jgi:hypothetical protein